MPSAVDCADAGVKLSQDDDDRTEEQLGVYDELVAGYGDSTDPAVRKHVATALFDKGFRLGQMGLFEEGLAVYDELVARYGEATDGGARAKRAAQDGLQAPTVGSY